METKTPNVQPVRNPSLLPSLPRVDYQASPKRHLNPAWIWIPILLALAVGGYFIYPRLHLQFGSAVSQAGRNRDAANRTTPVVAATARTGDVHIYLSGLGT